MALHVDILTPEKSLFKGEATAVQFPGTEGLFQILTDHAPIMASLTQGTIVIEGASGRTTVEIQGGVVEVSQNLVSVLAR
ncbi:MAG TPA: hypothetical protein DCL07_01990 [Cryomorphaceae bacterium]|jgi:F-type H+-transporting ATPase subunit epsilon|nr:MAG: ATP synthase subunit epsilon [Cryomorphaceae bacterium BACL7 MAG-120910-bin2]KRO68371.1 MAG: ATP synthase subunit epsilon [Cryomorphaceae bacterium BACL7 MAG-120322-bin74]KRO82466.1 MAG: ATP synthase subunit epsilon [Cryomorphaceae bacterium BACL7 MAG-121220-bin83]NQW25583.1 hypothetical protein [Cryomorphaceae bacterium]HAB32137.1 hypothetical protein [Cryomorphaceae bacterium]|tara:strand:- start:4003 stop:4242 length:240 start_codon:yes stop_codon:yes gene_type:complete